MSINACQGTRGVDVPCNDDAAGAPRERSGDASLLPAPMQGLVTSGDLGAQISGLILEIGHEQKKAAHVAREAAETAQQAEEERELQAMKDQADAKLAAGVLGGVLEAASAAALSTGINGSELTARVKSKGIDAFAKGSTAIVNSGADAQGEVTKSASNAVSREKSAVDDARTAERDAKETINKALDFYKEYQTAKADAQRAAFLKA